MAGHRLDANAVISMYRITARRMASRLERTTLRPASAARDDRLFIDIRVPIGDFVTHAARSVAAAQHRRAENVAHAEVVKALAEFQRAQPK
jgi:hypothetical protein